MRAVELFGIQWYTTFFFFTKVKQRLLLNRKSLVLEFIIPKIILFNLLIHT